MDVTKPYKFIGFGAESEVKPECWPDCASSRLNLGLHGPGREPARSRLVAFWAPNCDHSKPWGSNIWLSGSLEGGKPEFRIEHFDLGTRRVAEVVPHLGLPIRGPSRRRAL